MKWSSPSPPPDHSARPNGPSSSRAGAALSLHRREEGAGLRELLSLLLDLDKSRKWGNLRRVLTPTGDYLWLCRDHYPEYDPGLPKL